MVYPIIYRLIGFQPSFRWFLDFATIHDQRSMDPNGPFVSICCWMKLSFELNHLPVFVVFFCKKKYVSQYHRNDWWSSISSLAQPTLSFSIIFSKRWVGKNSTAGFTPLVYVWGVPKMGGIKKSVHDLDILDDSEIFWVRSPFLGRSKTIDLQFGDDSTNRPGEAALSGDPAGLCSDCNW